MVVKIKKIIKIFIIPIVILIATINYGCSPANILATGGGSALVCLLYTSPSPRDGW